MDKATVRIRRRVVWCDQSGSMSPMFVLVIAGVLLMMGTVALKVSTNDIKASGNQKKTVESLYIAEAGIARARVNLLDWNYSSLLSIIGSDTTRPTYNAKRLAQVLADKGRDTTLDVFLDTNEFGSGEYTVMVYDNDDKDGNIYSDADLRVHVRAMAWLRDGTNRGVDILLGRTQPPTASGDAAIVAAGDVQTLGNITIDGNDHDMDGNLLAGTNGTLAISTNGAFSRGGASKVGGVDDLGISYAPTKNNPGLSAVTEGGSTSPVPSSPDEALGLDEGTLMSLAKSGAGGSQYTTDPTKLTLPMSGVTYVDLPCGGTWQSMDFGKSEGVLIVRSPCGDATLKNLNGGTFKGVIIADDIVHIHNDIIGMIQVLRKSPGMGNCIGNGNGHVKYSSEAIGNALNSIGRANFVLAWKEI